MRFVFCYRAVEGREREASKDPSHDIEPNHLEREETRTHRQRQSSSRDGQGHKQLAAEPSTDPV
jgi:hypothetical protein